VRGSEVELCGILRGSDRGYCNNPSSEAIDMHPERE
jgi:hypothetical protein